MGDIVDNITDIKSSNAASSVTSPVAVVSLSGPADASKQPPSVEEHSNDKSSVHAVAAEMTTTQKDAVSDTDIAGDGTIVCDVDIQAPSKSNELEKEPVAGVPSSTTSASTASEAESQPQTNTEAATDAVQIMDNGTTGVIPAGTRMVARSRFLVDPTKVLEHNAWDDVEWDKDHFEYARKRVAEQALHPVDEEAKGM
ncbi:hypothetical protein SARC_12083 [Sphaeroforma arctica JP610]|uniref:Uncharacterized protein n=1 Tax=Sphaeroforma arctica JP610 TaxID=667725 RepID=A0A0L0FF34_9EUKA|nr:hypothetical protein SARC_12083 [Sphaeroforma arctica JP610]KNC75389.1 hypothetical protein SARC_12083 [Sphaeroforma arctica JP610]|eukprot:XP_014149291.1 hypothetical protein SARC_12083 [Sphaeroforma arctica JP610]